MEELLEEAWVGEWVGCVCVGLSESPGWENGATQVREEHKCPPALVQPSGRGAPHKASSACQGLCLWKEWL